MAVLCVTKYEPRQRPPPGLPRIWFTSPPFESTGWSSSRLQTDRFAQLLRLLLSTHPSGGITSFPCDRSGLFFVVFCFCFFFIAFHRVRAPKEPALSPTGSEKRTHCCGRGWIVTGRMMCSFLLGVVKGKHMCARSVVNKLNCGIPQWPDVMDKCQTNALTPLLERCREGRGGGGGATREKGKKSC